MSLVTLPQELLLAIAQQLSDRDLSHIAATSRYALSLLEPELYQRGLQYVGPSTPALVWATGFQRVATVQKVFTDSQPEGILLFDALMEAAGRGNVELTKLLLQHGAPTDLDENQRVEFLHRRALWSSSPLGAAAGREYPDTVSLLLKHGARVDARNEHGFTALWFAGIRPARACIAVLIEAGADINVRDRYGSTPFDNLNQLSSMAPDSVAIGHFLQAGADLSGPRSPALDMISYGDDDCKRLVLKYGLPHRSNVPPSVLLLAAAALAYQGTARALLLRYEIDVDATVDKNGRNAVMLAARFGHDSTIRLLIPHITHPIESFRTANGRSILHLAVRSRSLSTVQLIASMSETLFTIRDESGDTPLLFTAGHDKDWDTSPSYEQRTCQSSEGLHPKRESRVEFARATRRTTRIRLLVTFLSILLFLFMFFLMFLRLS
ncbi:ankyrin repeat-containing domain protein [Aspergillus pseudodeflectus]|uniref:Ankyrin repeat-containing domain protein n=1 Tax=Aspergillus pseudodeflectus TaxID=176178 RepID=A0ABR4JTN9_9EURO